MIDHTYCITLRRHQARREKFQLMMEKFPNLPVELVEGFDAVELGIKPVFLQPEQWKGGGAFISISPGMMGCTLSHLMIWKMALSAGYENTLILEDDVKLPTYFLERFKEYYAELPSDWELVHVGHFLDGFVPKEDIVSEHVVTTSTYYTHCYLVRHSVLPTLINTTRRLDMETDAGLVLNTFPYIKHYAFMPSLASQRTIAREMTSLT